MSGLESLEYKFMVKERTTAMKKKADLRLHRTSHPLVYEVNIRVLLNELSQRRGERIRLDTIPDEVLDEWSSLGFDAVWLMGIWTTGKIGLDIARSYPVLQEEYRKVLPDLSERDVIGSPYAIKAYSIPPVLGGMKGLLHLRKRMRERGLALFLDFVGNHTARDHQWVSRHPEYYVRGSDGDDIRKQEYYFKARTAKGYAVLAYGRDPNYPGWTDTAQVDIRNPETRKVLVSTLKKISTVCDGVRCDMAMLLLTEVFERTWGQHAVPGDHDHAVGEFWAEAIRSVRENFPSFVFIAEAYWDLEWQLQQLGFDYTYDKKLYERLSHEGASSVCDHLKAEPDYQLKSLRFIENHDEQRAARTFASDSWHFAAATTMATVPGMAMLHEGQMDGLRIKLPVQLGRRPVEETSPNTKAFYQRLLKVISHDVFRHGEWKLLAVRPAWNENYSWSNFLAFWWCQRGIAARLVVINYAPHVGQCYVEMELEMIQGATIEFRDLLGSANYARERATIASRGMYFDLEPYGVQIFEVSPQKSKP